MTKAAWFVANNGVWTCAMPPAARLVPPLVVVKEDRIDDRFRPDWQRRVIDEAQQLDERLTRLSRFIDLSDAFLVLSAAEKENLRSQRTFMSLYLDILKLRISAFGRSPA